MEDTTSKLYKCITDTWKALKQTINGFDNASQDYWEQSAEKFSKIATEFNDTEIKTFAVDLCVASLNLINDLWRKEHGEED